MNRHGWLMLCGSFGLVLFGVSAAMAQQTAGPAGAAVYSQDAMADDDGLAAASEQGQTHLTDSFDWKQRAERIRGQRIDALKATKFPIHLRSMYLDRNKFDDTESEAWAVGGSAGLKTGYFRELLAVGSTVYTSQKLVGDEDKDGTLLLKSGQESYTVIGEIYGDLLIVDDVHAYVGRKEFDTPYINRNDVRMTPNTFEAAVVQGRAKLGDEAQFKYGGGYFDAIKERNADEFVSMSKDAGAKVDRGVYTGGGLFEQGPLSVGAVDYWSDDIINIAYGEAKYVLPVVSDLKLKFAAQYSDQRGVGDNLLKGKDFEAHQAGAKVDLPLGRATLTAGYTDAGGDANMQNPWSGYPGYTSVQVQDFNRDGEAALLLKAAYSFASVKGLSAYGLWVNGTSPDDPKQFAQDEYDANVQWAAPDGMLKGLTLRARYALITEDGGDTDDMTDLRMICYYDVPLWR